MCLVFYFDLSFLIAVHSWPVLLFSRSDSRAETDKLLEYLHDATSGLDSYSDFKDSNRTTLLVIRIIMSTVNAFSLLLYSYFFFAVFYFFFYFNSFKFFYFILSLSYSLSLSRALSRSLALIVAL